MLLKVQTKSACSFTVLTRLLRRYSTALVENVESNQVEVTTSEVVIKEEDKYKTERDIPFMFLPHTVKKAFQVHPTTLRLPRIFDKYKWLSKTITTQGLPAHYSNAMEDKEKYNELLKEFHDSLLHTVAYVKEYRNVRNARYVPERINFSMMSNMFRLTTMFAEDDAIHLLPENSFLYHEPLLETHWPRDYKFYQTWFRPTFVLRTRNKLDILEEPRAVTPDEVSCLPGPYDTYALNMYRQHIVHLRNRPAMDNYKLNPIKHCHTTIMQNNRMENEEQFLSLGVMTMFSQLAAQAQADGVLHGTELKQPLVTQCIVTDGHKVAFMVYQLNTLYMLDDKGAWNRCWHSPWMQMFERRRRERSTHLNMVFEDAETGDELKGFNEECFRLFRNFIRKKTV